MTQAGREPDMTQAGREPDMTQAGLREPASRSASGKHGP